MINTKLQEAINKQINAEIYSAYLYLSMRAYFDSNDLPGFAQWMYVQALEEFTHADKFYKHVISRGGKVKLTAIDGPEINWKDALAVVENVLSHEQKVTGLINDLVNLSTDEKDHAAKSFLQWFVDEQVEEEANAMEMVRKIKMIKNDPGAMFMLDKEAGTRVFVPPVTKGV